MVMRVTMLVPSHIDREKVSISPRYEEEAQSQVDERKECAECQTESLAMYATGTKTNTSILSHTRSKDAVQYRGVGRQPNRPLRPRETERPYDELPRFVSPEISGFLQAGRRTSSVIWLPAGKWSLYVDWLDGRAEGIIRSTFVLRLGTHGSWSNNDEAAVYLERQTGPMNQPSILSSVTWPSPASRYPFQTDEYEVYKVAKNTEAFTARLEWWIATQ